MKKAICFIIFVIGIPVTHSWAINTSDYIPLNSGDSWTYLEDGYKTITNYVLPGTFYVNGYPTKITASSVDSTQIYSSNDTNGFRRHKEIAAINVDGTNYNVTGVYSPPMLFSSANFNIGDRFNSTGLFSMTMSGIGTYTLEYSSTTQIVGYETVTVPYGTFSTIKINLTLLIYGYIEGHWFSMTMSSDAWIAQYLGAVKSISTADGVTTTEVLTNTNIILPADSDSDGVYDNSDNCVNTPNPNQTDTDSDSFGDACDNCPSDPSKIEPGVCGCGTSDILNACGECGIAADADGDGIANCIDGDDTDGDGFTDAEEVLCDSDPADSASRCNIGLPWLMLLLDD